MWGPGREPALPLPTDSSRPRPGLPALSSLAGLLGWGHLVLSPDASPVRVRLPSLLCCLSTRPVLPEAAVRLCVPQFPAPLPQLWPPLEFLELPGWISGRTWGNGRLNPRRKGWARSQGNSGALGGESRYPVSSPCFGLSHCVTLTKSLPVWAVPAGLHPGSVGQTGPQVPIQPRHMVPVLFRGPTKGSSGL